MANPTPPPPLPVSTPPSTFTTTTTQPPPITTPALRTFLSNISTTVLTTFSHRRPWSELLDRSAFSKPDSFSHATLRIRNNYSYFRVNYIALVAFIVAFSLFSHPFSLVSLLVLLAAWLFLYLLRPSSPPLVLFGRTFTESETLGMLILTSIVVIFITNVGSLLISSVMIGMAIVCAHGAFRAPEDLFLDEQDHSAAAGFLSILGGAASNVAAAAAPIVAPRV